MCINIYVCIYICICLARVHASLSLPLACVCATLYLPVSACVRVYVCVSSGSCLSVCTFVCVRMCVCARANHFIILHSKEIPMRNSKHPSLWANVLEQLMALINFMSLVIRHFIENMSFLSFMSRHFISCRLIQTERFCSNRTIVFEQTDCFCEHVSGC